MDVPVNRFTHQELPFERFYAESGDDLTTDAILIGVGLVNAEFAAGLYNNRNRWYSPALGRFTSADPNATAMPIVTAMAFNAEALDSLLSAFDAAGHFGDGMNLYIYLGANPVNRLDALGLSWNDPFDAVDEIIAAITGGRVAAAQHTMAMFGSMAQAAGTMAIHATLAALFPPYGMYLSVQGAHRRSKA